MYRAGAMSDWLKEMDKHKMDICCLQEIRLPAKGTVIKKRNILGDVTVTNMKLEQDFILADLL
jgi:exonuclease III